MSRKSPTEFSELFKQSPMPKSPPELDQRILDYARRNAPQPSLVRQPLLLTTAATLSVACIGLLVVLRSGDPTLPEIRPQQAPLATPAADWQNAPAISDSAAEQQSSEISAKISRAEPERETSKRRLANSEQTRAEVKSDLAAAPSPAKTQSRVRAFSSAMRNQTLSAPDASLPEKAETTVLDDALGMAAPQSLEQATVQEALLANDKKPQTPAKHTKIKVNDKDMRESLQEIRRLYANGKKGEAEKAYRKLRERCEECDLPESLTRALEELDKERAK